MQGSRLSVRGPGDPCAGAEHFYFSVWLFFHHPGVGSLSIWPEEDNFSEMGTKKEANAER